MLENGAVFYASLEIVRRLIELGRKDTREALAKAGLARDGTPAEDMELWQSLNATYDAEGRVLATNDGIEDSAPQGYGAVRVTTAGGSASYPVQYPVH